MVKNAGAYLKVLSGLDLSKCLCSPAAENSLFSGLLFIPDSQLLICYICLRCQAEFMAIAVAAGAWCRFFVSEIYEAAGVWIWWIALLRLVPETELPDLEILSNT